MMFSVLLECFVMLKGRGKKKERGRIRKGGRMVPLLRFYNLTSEYIHKDALSQ